MRVSRTLTVLVAGAVASAALAQADNRTVPPPLARALQPMALRPAPAERTAVTHHRAVVNGRPLSYRALVTETTLAGGDGKPAAVAVTYAYLVDQPAGARARPVLFVFNGGPGASSEQLHLHGIGPRRIDHGRPVDNDASPLDVADLVFIDPVGTGASMPIRGGDPQAFFGTEGDARSVIEIIARWKAANGRTHAPTLLLGESYGTYRVAQILAQDAAARRLGVDGVVLLSLVTGDTGQDVVFPVTLLPTLAAVAWYHRRVERVGRTVQQHYDAALAFAQTEYARALIAGASLPPPERARIAGRMSALIGIPAATLDKGGLAIDQDAFMAALLGNDRRTGKLDARVTRPLADSRFQPPYDDPSMTLGTAPADTVMRYLHDELGYVPPSPYRSLNLGINRQWRWGDAFQGRFDIAPAFAAAFGANPRLRVMSISGLYDITTPAYAARFALDHAGIPAQQRTDHLYAAGHGVFEDDDARSAAGHDLRRFVRDVVPR